jgi:hypothetical protein
MSMGMTTGVVMQSGAGSTECVGIVNGIAQRHTCEWSDIGGDWITDDLVRVLAPNEPKAQRPHQNLIIGPSLSTYDHRMRRAISHIKHQFGYVTHNMAHCDVKSAMSIPSESSLSYTLPDGRQVSSYDVAWSLSATTILFDNSHRPMPRDFNSDQTLRTMQDTLISSLQVHGVPLLLFPSRASIH